MKHYVFCCSNEYPERIKVAKHIVDLLELHWMLEHDCIMQAYHSKFSVREDNFNTEISLENENVSTLIDDAMLFARELALIDSIKTNA